MQVISKTNVKRSKIDCLREEAKLLSTIEHPNIVKVYDFVETDTFIYLKM
jgi:serine/threonine protein kinase